jgi:hypothetical protein
MQVWRARQTLLSGQSSSLLREREARMKGRDRESRRRLHNPPLLRLISGVALACMVYYLWWRAAAALNPEALAFSWALLLVEAFRVFSYGLFAWMTLDTSPSRPTGQTGCNFSVPHKKGFDPARVRRVVHCSTRPWSHG